MTADRRVPVEGADERPAVCLVVLLEQLLARLDDEIARNSERLDRLDAAVGRARDDAVDLVAGEQLHERLRLAPALVVQRPQPVVARPPVAVAGTRVADQQDHACSGAQAQARRPRRSSRFHAFGSDARARARRACCRSTSRPAPNAASALSA